MNFRHIMFYTKVDTQCDYRSNSVESCDGLHAVAKFFSSDFLTEFQKEVALFFEVLEFPDFPTLRV